MNKFIAVTDIDTDSRVVLNSAYIIEYSQSPKGTGSIIQINGGQGSYAVKESINDIDRYLGTEVVRPYDSSNDI